MAAVTPRVLAINAGSSSLKASLFEADGARRNFHYRYQGNDADAEFRHAFTQLFDEFPADVVDVVAHRFVHGGNIVQSARLLDEAETARLQGIVGLAPLHLPSNLRGVTLSRAHFRVPQIACFDTAFHATLPPLAYRLPIPEKEGMRRYGFHGLSYAYLAGRLPDVLGELAYGRVILAHLGSGASLCLLENLKSVETTMGYTPAGGIPMASRAGDLDPGVMLELARRHDTDTLAEMVNHGMGLKALSRGEGGNMEALLASGTSSATFAVDYFCRQVTGAIGSLAARAGGVDALVFSGGIGEKATPVRLKICRPLAFLGLELDLAANEAHALCLHATGSKPVLCMPTDEEAMMRKLALEVAVDVLP